MTLFLTLCRNQIESSTSDVPKLDFARMKMEWTAFLVNELRKSTNQDDVFAKYRFKEACHLKEFKDLLVKRLYARERIKQNPQILAKLRKVLNEKDIVHLDAIRCKCFILQR